MYTLSLPILANSPPWKCLTLKRLNHLPFVLSAILMLTACSTGSDDPEPTAEPTATIVPTLPPGAMTVGDVIASVDAEWPTITSYRATSWSTEGANLSAPVASSPVTVEEVVLPSNRHIMQLTDGVVVDEQLLVDGRVYMKGAIVPAAIAPMMDTNTWIEVDPAAATSDTPIAMQVAYLTSPIVSPFAGVSTETRGLQAVPIDDVQVEGRTCRAFSFGTESEGGLRFEISVDEQNLPCRLVQTASGFSSVTVYEFNLPDLVLAAPTIATPAP